MHAQLHIGLIVIFGIVMLPVYAMLIGWFVGKPREYKPVALAFGYIAIFIVATVVGLGILGTVIGFVM